MLKKSIDIVLVDGTYGGYCGFVEVISIKDNSLLHVDTNTPLLPNGMFGLQGAKLPSGDLVVCGGKNVLSICSSNQDPTSGRK